MRGTVRRQLQEYKADSSLKELSLPDTSGQNNEKLSLGT